VTTDYGRLLAAKIACFGFMLVLASVNRWILVPRIRADSRVDGRSMQPLGWLLCSVACELVLGVVVLVLAAFLGITPPASHEHSGHAMHHIM
jgi:putative copper resistance protein D